MIHYPKILDAIFSELIYHGAQPLIVGGYIRDSLLGLASKDIDIEVYHIASFDILEEILEKFGSVNIVGKSFGVCKLSLDDLDLDFTLPRRENHIAKGHRGFSVSLLPDLDFYSAFSRRDFTVNAIGYDVATKEIIDPFHGMKDLETKILRYVNKKSFTEDPLRVLRAMQFSARFELSIDPSLQKLCHELIKNNALRELSQERVFEEIKKLFLKAKKPSIGLTFLHSIEAFTYFKPLTILQELSLLKTMNALDTMACEENLDDKVKLPLMLAILCYELPKIEQTNLLTQLTNDTKLLKETAQLLTYLPKIKEKMSDFELLTLAADCNLKRLFTLAEFLEDFKTFSLAEKRVKASELGVLESKREPLLRGKDLQTFGIEPSKEYTQILQEAYKAQLQGEFSDISQAHKWLKCYLGQ